MCRIILWTTGKIHKQGERRKNKNRKIENM
jgi:hypothetical protein